MLQRVTVVLAVGALLTGSGYAQQPAKLFFATSELTPGDENDGTPGRVVLTLWSSDETGAAPKRLIDLENPREVDWSPNGRYFAFVQPDRDQPDRKRLWAMDCLTETAIAVSDKNHNAAAHFWDESSSRLVYLEGVPTVVPEGAEGAGTVQGSFDVWVRSLGPGGAPVRVNGDIKAAPAPVVTSADGKFVAFAVSDETNANQVAIADTAGGGAWQASQDLKVAFHQWSLVGSKLALMAQTSAGILNLYVVSAEDRTVRRVSDPSHAVRGFSWRPGHEMLAYTVVARGLTAEEEPSVTFDRTLVYMADLATNQPWLVTGIANAAQLMWAPDGSHYAVTDLVEAPGGQVPTIRVGACEGNLRVPILVRYSTGVALFNWSPDSSRISFISQNSLWCFNSTTLRTDLVANSLIVRDVSWAPDSARMLVLAPVEQNAIGAWSVDVAAGKGRLISHGFQGGVVDWAPDSKAVMLMLTRSPSSADLYLLDPAGTPDSAKLVHKGVLTATWFPARAS